MRTALRVVMIVAGALVVIALGTALGVRAFLASDQGQRLALDRLQGESRAQTGLEVQAGSLRGSMVSSARLEDVRLRDETGREVARVDRLVAHYDPISLARRRPRVSIDLYGVHLRPGLPRVRLPKRLPHLKDAAVDIRVHDLGREGVGLRARYRDGRVDAWLDPVTLSPEELHALLPARMQPRRPLQLRGSVSGPLDALAVALDADTGAGTVRVRSTIDVPAKRADATIAVDGLHADFVPSAETMVLWADARLRARGRQLTVTVDGRYRHRRPAPDLPMPAARRHAFDTPGGELHGQINARLEHGLSAEFEGRLRDAGGATRLLEGGSVSVARADVTVRGRFEKPPHRPGELKVKTSSVPR